MRVSKSYKVKCLPIQLVGFNRQTLSLVSCFIVEINLLLQKYEIKYLLNKALSIQCVVPENIHTTPTEGKLKFLGGGGFLKTPNYKEMYGI